MAIESRTQIKTYFEPGDFPTGAQFATFIDSAAHVNDNIRLVSISSDGTFIVPVGKSLNWLGIVCNAAGTIKIGTTGAGSSDIYPERTVTSGQEIGLNVSIWARLAAKTVYVTTNVSLTLHIREFISSPLT